MFNNTAFDIVIGLIFIYLLYSLLATVLSEIIVTWMGLRARNLKEAIDRMLNDEEKKGWWARLKDSMRLMKNPKNPLVDNFYAHPEIKYLGSSGLFSIPSAFKAESFSKTIMFLLNENSALDKKKIESRLRDAGTGVFGKETAAYVLSLWDDAQGDLVKFKLLLEGWFNRTMEQATEWYKRKIRIVLLVLGFILAWFFNADSFTIISRLSTDKDAREKMVAMATAYVENNKQVATVDTTTVSRQELDDYKKKLDSLLEVKRKLEVDINNANTILGLGGWLPDSVKVIVDSAANTATYIPQIDADLVAKNKKAENGYYKFKHGEKWGYFFSLLYKHFYGFLLTAIAISLGAPFWFDLLNKVMRLRTSAKHPVNTSGNSNDSTVSPLNREG